ncbi:putative phage tail assembly chaperone [Endozoicomonas montiporae]|uniref:Phage protein n=1 Tax=Endozoicomonas montiporae CL-33 TaxID=570277 RepID=A0A142BB63_9GAMM|nr:putative phage tail assembly chaperone [Endozoicomonas montiporae]AMO55989.1 phage protein [Endozoicomonas montiporae CL-33]
MSRDRNITLELDPEAQELLGIEEMNFKVTLIMYNDCVNGIQPSSKVAPMHNFLVRCSADDETKAAVKKAYQEALTTDLFGLVMEEYKPKVDFAVKK